ncbi:hypothetical protein [Stieleria bergensis]
MTLTELVLIWAANLILHEDLPTTSTRVPVAVERGWHVQWRLPANHA